jgi:hypothetical protein
MQVLSVASKEVGLEVGAESTEYVFMSREMNARENRNVKTANKSFENVAEFKDLGTTPIWVNSHYTSQHSMMPHNTT